MLELTQRQAEIWQFINAYQEAEGYLAVHATRAARPGRVVVARSGNEATLKRLWIERGRPELRPERPGFTPIVPGPERGDPTSAGIVVGPIRPDGG